MKIFSSLHFFSPFLFSIKFFEELFVFEMSLWGQSFKSDYSFVSHVSFSGLVPVGV
jgi:hypothetical protein